MFGTPVVGRPQKDKTDRTKTTLQDKYVTCTSTCILKVEPPFFEHPKIIFGVQSKNITATVRKQNILGVPENRLEGNV